MVTDPAVVVSPAMTAGTTHVRPQDSGEQTACYSGKKRTTVKMYRMAWRASHCLIATMSRVV